MPMRSGAAAGRQLLLQTDGCVQGPMVGKAWSERIRISSLHLD